MLYLASSSLLGSWDYGAIRSQTTTFVGTELKICIIFASFFLFSVSSQLILLIFWSTKYLITPKVCLQIIFFFIHIIFKYNLSFFFTRKYRSFLLHYTYELYIYVSYNWSYGSGDTLLPYIHSIVEVKNWQEMHLSRHNSIRKHTRPLRASSIISLTNRVNVGCILYAHRWAQC